MNHPGLTEFRNAIQNPDLTLAIPGLRGWTPATGGPLQLPLSWSGSFAVVFKLVAPQGGASVALRCQTNPIPAMADRYQAFEAFYRTAPQSLRRHLLEVSYHPQGIRVVPSPSAPAWPVVVMAWSPGTTFSEWIAQAAQDPRQLQALQGQLAGLSREMAQAGLVHGDLQHRNLMVAPDGCPVLVDYDSVVVPATRNPGPACGGVPGFRHPLQGPGTPPACHDRFAFLVFHLGLEALQVQPDLFRRFGKVEGFLITGQDLANPDPAPIFQALRNHAGLRPLAEAFLAVCRAKAEDTPDLATFLARLGKNPSQPSPSRLPAYTLHNLNLLNQIYGSTPLRGAPMPAQVVPPQAATPAKPRKSRSRRSGPSQTVATQVVAPAGPAPACTFQGAFGSPPQPSPSAPPAVQAQQALLPPSRAWALAAVAAAVGLLVWGFTLASRPEGLAGTARFRTLRAEAAKTLEVREEELEKLIVGLDRELEAYAQLPPELPLITLRQDGEVDVVTVTQRRRDLAQTREDARLAMLACPATLKRIDAILGTPGMTPDRAIPALLAVPGLPRAVREDLERPVQASGTGHP